MSSLVLSVPHCTAKTITTITVTITICRRNGTRIMTCLSLF